MAPALLDPQRSKPHSHSGVKEISWPTIAIVRTSRYAGPASERESESREERIRNGIGEDVRSVADEEDEDFEDLDDIEDDDDSDGSF